MNKKTLYIASVFCLLAFSGCTDSAPINTEQDPNLPVVDPNPECETADDCDSGRCLDSGKCALLVGLGESCEEDVCESPYVCKDGICAEDKDVEKPECTSDGDCASNKCLPSGKCQKISEEGGLCDEENVCPPELTCLESTCQKRPEGAACSDSEPCGPALECKDNKCQTIPCDESEDICSPLNAVCENNVCAPLVILPENSPCDPESKSKSCDTGLECIENICQTPDVETLESDACTTDSDCAKFDLYKTCLPTGRCGTVVGLGDFCDNKMVCADGQECNIFCAYIRGEGEKCDAEAYEFCNEYEGLSCYNGECHTPQYDLPIGSTCNDTYLSCAEDLECLNNKCVTRVDEDAHCSDAEYLICKAGMECINAKCIPVGGACITTADCQEKDSFCCLSDECGAKNKCRTYDETTTYDEACRFTTKPGIFEAQIQCRWQPPKDQLPTSTKVEMPPLVGHFGNKAGLDPIVAFWSYAAESSNNSTGKTAIRFINPETCETLETVDVPLRWRWYNYPAAADLDGDGLLEFVTIHNDGKPIAYKWDDAQKKHVQYWKADAVATTDISIHDLDGNGTPEVIIGTHVFNGQTGKRIVAGGSWTYATESIGNFDNNAQGIASILANGHIYKWNPETNKWIDLINLAEGIKHTAYADFGTPGATPEDFDFTKLDGKPEFALAGGSKLQLYAVTVDAEGKYHKQQIMNVAQFSTGGPITIGDFNNDGLPEIGLASSGKFGVYDPKCKGYEEGRCADKFVMWERWSQDASSGSTGSSLFDFDGDGQTEAVYADECFTRVYDGKTGRVLFSAKRSSWTSIEAPVVADIDGDGSSEIMMGSDYAMTCKHDTGSSQTGMDPIHEGIRCTDDEDCPLAKGCNKEVGLCTCTSDNDCNTQHVYGKDTILQQYVCTAPIDPNVGFYVNKTNANSRTMVANIGARPAGWNANSGYKVCRASRATTDIGQGDLMIFKDRLDRWVSSRPLWNQHGYNIINIEDNGKVPTPIQWLMNWLQKDSKKTITGTTYPRPTNNSFRLNRQGEYGAGVVPDITGRFIAGSICGETEDGRHVISGNLCNRGTKPVSTKLPATFFYFDENAPDHRGEKICTSYTKSIVGVGECAQVGCDVEDIKALEGKKVIMVTNLDEYGQPSTVECRSDNNTDTIQIDKCKTENDAPIIIVN